MGSPEQASASDGAASQETPEQQQHQQQGAPPRDYQKLYEEIKGRPCRVDRISKLYERDEAKPLRTRQHLIDRELERVYDANTLEEIHEALEQAGRNLSKLAIFQDVQMLVHEDPEVRPQRMHDTGAGVSGQQRCSGWLHSGWLELGYQDNSECCSGRRESGTVHRAGQV